MHLPIESLRQDAITNMRCNCRLSFQLRHEGRPDLALLSRWADLSGKWNRWKWHLSHPYQNPLSPISLVCCWFSTANQIRPRCSQPSPGRENPSPQPHQHAYGTPPFQLVDGVAQAGQVTLLPHRQGSFLNKTSECLPRLQVQYILIDTYYCRMRL
jgi:hypothetical protein